MLFYRTARAIRRAAHRLVLLAVSFVIAGPLLAARFDVDPAGLNLYALRRFHLLPAIVLAPAIALALDHVGGLLASRLRVRAEIAAILVVIVFASDAATGLPEIARVRTPAVERSLHAMLANLPANAVVLISGDVPYFGTGYLQVARGERPDVIVALWHFVGVGWYRERLANRGLVIESREDDAKPSIGIAEAILASGRPLFVDMSLGNVLKEMPSYPYGTLFRDLAPRPGGPESGRRGRTEPRVVRIARARLSAARSRRRISDADPRWLRRHLEHLRRGLRRGRTTRRRTRCRRARAADRSAAVKRWLVDRGGLLGLAVAIVYIAIASPSIADGDSAEFVTLANVGGVAHPSGYPLYLLLLRATSWLPGSTPASTAATVTALVAAAQIIVLHAACRAWGARATAATIAVAIYAGAPIVMRIHSEAEVFALNGLVVATILWLAAAEGPLRGGRRVVMLALVAGLGMANHMSCTIVAPVGLVGAVRGMRESGARIATAAAALSVFVVGLSPYLYLFATSGSAAAWSPVSTFDDLVGVITRRDYGGAGAFAAIGGDTTATRNFEAFAITLGRSWLWLPALAGVVTLAVKVIRPGDRVGWAALAASWLVAGPILVASFNVPPEQLGLYICQRFHLLPVLLLAVPVAVAIDAGLARVRVPSFAGVVAPIVFAITAVSALPFVARVRTDAIELSSRNLLRSLPDRAVVIVRDDDLFYGPIYLQELTGERPDVTVVSWWMLVFPSYRQRLAARGLVVDPHAATPGPPARRIASQVFVTGRPLFVETTDPNFGRVFPSYPFGVVARVLPAGTSPPSLDAIVAANRDVFARFDLSDPKPGPDDEYPTAIHSRYAFTWLLLAKALADAGRFDDGKAAIAVAREIGPQP